MNSFPFCNTEINICNKLEMQKLLLSYNFKNVLIIISETASKRWELQSFVMLINEKCKLFDGDFLWLTSINANPTQKDLLNSLKLIGKKKIDVIIAFGGGSSIDLAKGISAFYDIDKNDYYNLDQITKEIINKNYNNSFLDIIAIPSTAGTGSEVTQWATIWDINKEAKYSIDDYRLKPKLALIVPELTITMNSFMTLSTGLDALSHAIESYWSRYTSLLIQEIALSSIKLIIDNLKKTIVEPSNLYYRTNLLLASVLSGIAFSQTRTTACHSISYPLTMQYNISHGLAASITLSAIGEINKGFFDNDNRLFNLFNDYGSIKNFIDSVSQNIIVMRLSEFGVKEEDLNIIAEKAMTNGRMDNNPVLISKEIIFKVLKSIL